MIANKAYGLALDAATDIAAIAMAFDGLDDVPSSSYVKAHFLSIELAIKFRRLKDSVLRMEELRDDVIKGLIERKP